MRYRIHSGVVLETVCGEHLLLATRASCADCPYVQQLNDTAAFFWRQLEKTPETEQLARAAAEKYSLSEAEILPGLQRFLDSMEELGYIRREEEAI